MRKLLLAVLTCAALASPVRAQQSATLPGPSAIFPVSQGATVITLSYPGPNGQTLQAKFNLVIPPAQIALIRPINALNPARWTDSAVTNAPFCMFGWATDAAGRTLAGRPIGWSTNDSSIARAVRSPTCPDTTIDPAKMQTFPLPQPQVVNTATSPPEEMFIKHEELQYPQAGLETVAQ